MIIIRMGHRSGERKCGQVFFRLLLFLLSLFSNSSGGGNSGSIVAVLIVCIMLIRSSDFFLCLGCDCGRSSRSGGWIWVRGRDSVQFLRGGDPIQIFAKVTFSTVAATCTIRNIVTLLCPQVLLSLFHRPRSKAVHNWSMIDTI